MITDNTIKECVNKGRMAYDEKTNKKVLLCTLIHWLLSWMYDDFIFSNITIVTNIIRLFVLPLALYVIYSWIFKWAKKDFWIYLLFNSILLILIWPGAWKWDDIGVLHVVSDGMMRYWQHYFTYSYYTVALLIIPFPVGVIILQIMTISALFQICLARLKNIIGTKRYGTVLLWLPFLLPPVLLTNLWPMRMSIYTYIEIFLIIELIYYKLQAIEWTYKMCAEIIILCAILSNWRSEGIYYIMAVPILCLTSMGGGIKKYLQKIVILLGCVLASVILLIPQYYGTQKYNGNNYELTGILLPLLPLVDQAVENNNSLILNDVGKIFNISELERGYIDGYNGVQLYWNQREYPIIKQKYTNTEYRNFKKAYIILICTYPKTFVKERINTFIKTLPNGGPLTKDLFLDDRESVKRFRTEYKAVKPLNLKLRTDLAFFIENTLKTLWNPIFPITILLLLGCTMLLVKREYMWIYLTGMGRMLLTFLTAPAMWFMYYYTWYLGGWIVLMIIVAYLVSREGK